MLEWKRNRVSFFLLLTGLLVGIGSYGQELNSVCVFEPGEKVTYEIAYNYGYMWVNAGEVYFKVQLDTLDGKPVYIFESYGTSHSFYDWFYKVRDKFQSTVERDSFQPLRFIRDNSEGGHTVYNSYIFDYKTERIYTSVNINNQFLKQDTIVLLPKALDVLTAVYHARNINYSNCQKGEKIPFRILINGEYHDLFLRYWGPEIKKNRKGKKYQCIKLSALLVEGTMFKGGEDLFVWVTDDENRIPIMIEAKIKVGSIKAYLTGYENIKFDLPEAE